MPGSTFKQVVRRVRRFGRTLIGRDFGAEPEVGCPRMRLGTEYGGWWVNPELLSAQSAVFCVGVGSDVSFDLAMIERFGCTVHAFDPTPKAVAWVTGQTFPPRFVFHPLGLADDDGEMHFILPGEHPSWDSYKLGAPGSTEERGAADRAICHVRRLETLVREVGVGRVDLLKMDIEGGEYAVIRDLLAGTIRPRQLLVEFHYLGAADHAANFDATVKAVRDLRQAGYRIFARSPHGLEFSFLFAG